MLDYTSGNIMEADAEALVNSVNCVGIMGRGIALQFKRAFPENFEAYAAACRRGEVQPGRMFVYEIKQLANPRYIINFPTKRHWRGKSRLVDIEVGLEALVDEMRSRGIKSVAIPPLGTGLGGLSWADVRPRIEHALRAIPNVRVIVFEPTGEPVAAEVAKSPKVPVMTPGRAALVGLVHRYLAGLMDPFVTLLEVHKLMYFMQEAGERLRLRYVVALYGPYAENLRHVLREVEGYFISGYAGGGEEPDKQLQLVPGAVSDAEAFFDEHASTRQRFDRVADLVEGFETPFGLELLSTVHWVATRGGVTTVEDVIAQTYAWGDRKRQFTEEQLRLAFKVLEVKGWLPAALSRGATEGAG